ncbi:MAG: hypothetical protein GX892_13030 [Thermoanaerobacteraceae bacterium]|nr:hypothetical protein [Thermoanaerobacteraceae bacterium]
MEVFSFEKKGVTFIFRNPEWNESYKYMELEWKVSDIKENTKNDDGFFYCSKFLPQEKQILFPNNIVINGQKVKGVSIPDEDVYKKLKEIYDKMMSDYIQKKLHQDIEYRLNDMTAYGIYNGISQFDIEYIVADIREQVEKETGIKVLIFADDIAKKLTKDEEIIKIAEETYRPYPESKNWTEEYRSWYRKAIENKTAPGYGIISNKIIREKIRKLLLEEVEEVKKEKEKIEKLFKKAKETGEKQLITKWIESCNDRTLECSTDMCYLYAMPDGIQKVERIHTF